ncbi:DUF3592 domain-containing protein [Oceanobacillus jeddahense]|uniref:DUF3592 domain-containing protein n=1 Tax=Oceanobacillus jeddahense TaxID=1462527 RepID=UPI0005963A45|nr:DUF3592 domain-containing protein [Oceanobacillus jeddahense]
MSKTLIFIGLLLCAIALFVIIIKVKTILNGKLVEGKIVGYVRSAKGTHGMVSYNYKILLEYNEEMYYVTSIDSLTGTDGGIPRKNLGMYCNVYFNPKSPEKRVAIKGFRKLEWIAFFLFLMGFFMIIIELNSIL